MVKTFKNLEESLDTDRKKVNGFIFHLFECLMWLFKCGSLVELFKKIADKLSDGKDDSITKMYRNVAIDLFNAFKWIALIVLWFGAWVNIATIIIIIYLTFYNLFSYFYYHSWDSRSLIGMTFDRLRRRLITAILSFIYSGFCFAYIYHILCPSWFYWSENVTKLYSAIYFSFGNSLTGYLGDMKAVTGAGMAVNLTQLLISFIFITIILSNSLINKDSIQDKENTNA